MRRLSAALACVLIALLVSPHALGQQPEPGAPAPNQNRDDLFQDDIGARTRHAAELEIITDRDWNEDDGHGSIGLGFSWSLSLQRPENFRLLTLYVGVLFGQLGDDHHKWVQFQGGYRPTLEIPVDFEIKPYVGPRAIFSANQYDGPGSADLDGAFAVGGAVGGRLLGGLLAVEATADAVYSLGTGFRVGTDDGDWVPRVGLGIKTDFCAFEAGDGCHYKAPKPVDVDLGLVMARALKLLSAKLVACDMARCGPTDAAVTLQIHEPDKHPRCGPADVEGFFCRLNAGSKQEERVAIDLTREVHSALEACYTQGRLDERSAAKADRLLVRKLRYGAYAPEFRRLMGCDPEAAKVPPLETDDQELLGRLQKQRDDARDNLELAGSACPLAALALRRLEHEIKPGGD